GRGRRRRTRLPARPGSAAPRGRSVHRAAVHLRAHRRVRRSGARRASERPFLFGLLLGVTGSFRANMLWLAPLLAAAAALSAPRGRRVRVLALALAGFALPLVPWWIYKWRAFGDPGWDLTRFVVWDDVQGRTWFSLYHLPELPYVPAGAAALQLLAA